MDILSDHASITCTNTGKQGMFEIIVIQVDFAIDFIVCYCHGAAIDVKDGNAEVVARDSVSCFVVAS